jgi:hypothetical protein
MMKGNIFSKTGVLLSAVIMIACFKIAINMEVGGAGGDGYFLRIVAILIGVAALWYLIYPLKREEGQFLNVGDNINFGNNIYGPLIKEVQKGSESLIRARHTLRLANSCGMGDTPEAWRLKKILDESEEGKDPQDSLGEAVDDLRRINLKKVTSGLEEGGWRKEIGE